MHIDLYTHQHEQIAEVTSDEVLIRNTQDALDLMANCVYQGAEKIILHERNFTPEFFDLKSGLAGDILQKFSNYRVLLVLIGDFSKYSSKSLQDFIRESNRGTLINFKSSIAEVKRIGNQ